MAQEKGIVREYLECVAIALVLAFFIITFVVQSFVVDGSSMEPTLHHGQRLLVNKFIYYFTRPQRGDIIVFQYPANPREDFIKRVIGVGGDHIQIKDGKVFVNGHPLEEPYLLEPTYGDFEGTVPPDSYFVLGDNRNNSRDSRYPDVGMLLREDIIGKAALIYWPPGDIGLINSKREIYSLGESG
ncbi:MAG: signal peptidase I [bacterium]|nr:signal peptidase I [Bacillota bacterium]